MSSLGTTDPSSAGPSSDGTAPSAPRAHVAIAVRLPDRPGALGAVASRIGAVGADITDVVVAGRSGGFAEDVFHVDLPAVAGVDVVGLLLSEIAQVDGVVAPSVSQPVEGCCEASPSP